MGAGAGGRGRGACPAAGPPRRLKSGAGVPRRFPPRGGGAQSRPSVRPSAVPAGSARSSGAPGSRGGPAPGMSESRCASSSVGRRRPRTRATHPSHPPPAAAQTMLLLRPWAPRLWGRSGTGLSPRVRRQHWMGGWGGLAGGTEGDTDCTEPWLWCINHEFWSTENIFF